MSTAALVGLDGSIDWCCLPRFDSPSLFGALLDAGNGGRFRISPSSPYTSAQRYLPATNILVTTFHTTDGGVVELTDFMPWSRGTRTFRGYHEIHRRITCTRGSVEVDVLFDPGFDYGASPAALRGRSNGVLATDRENEAVALSALGELWWELDQERGHATTRLKLGADESVWLVLRYDDDEVYPIEEYESQERLDSTAEAWDEWVSGLTYHGPYRAPVERSALVLKLQFFEPTGAIVAAPTTSLPEEIGGVRNWDYRFTWLRDAAFTLAALHGLGQYAEADQFMSYLKRVTRKAADHLQIMYGVGGERALEERVLEHMEGYRGSAPVRVGNAAYRQLQLDVYGEVMEAAYLWHENHRMTEGLWAVLQRLADWVAENWRRKDAGIWEVRAEEAHYVHSKVMCWVALDRAIRMAEKLEFDDGVERWREERDTLHAEVMDRGWNEEKSSFVQHYETTGLDAANLLIPRVGFLPPDHPRVVSTIEASLRELTGPNDELVYRYHTPDGLPGREGVFSSCAFWLADALILSGRVDEGEQIFLRMLRQANHLGLYSEQIHATTDEFLGNFPQALTHIALINTAELLERARGREPKRTDVELD